MKALYKVNCNKTRKLILVISYITLAINLIILTVILIDKYINTKGNKELREELSYVYEQIKNETKKVKENVKIQKLEQLQKINSDIVALIEIEGTNINYPVVKCNNNSYYMTHNYKKQKSKDGALFLDKNYDFQIPSTNLLIYGHNNIGSKEMFADLIKYKKQSFYNTHKTINFTTNKEEQTYKIISVFLSRVYYESEIDVFKYYHFINAYNQSDFDNYIINCKKASLYDIQTTAKYGDMLMTLSTCEYSKVNGRLVVVAKKITEK